MIMSKILNKIKNFFNKENFKILKLIISILLSSILSLLLEFLIFYKKTGFYSKDRVIILNLFLLFLSIHAIFNLRNMYKWIYEKRFLIAIIFLCFFVAMGYSGSSIDSYDYTIQSEVTDPSYKPLFGKVRNIRSDEWAVNTPLIFSQENQHDSEYSYFNMAIRGTKTDMFTIINAPIKNILTIGKPFNIGYILFGNRMGLSFWWYGRFIALMLISFEFCMILTKKNKLISLVGMILITFSPSVQWWYSNFIVDILIFGQLSLILVDKFMNSKTWYYRMLFILGIGLCAISYIFILYPAWMISFAYVYLALLVWIIIKNRKNFHIDKVDMLVIIITFVLVLLLVLNFFTMSHDAINLTLNTDYPGERFELGGNSQDNMFSYIYSVLMPFKDMNNPCEFSNMFSLYPMPILLSIIYLFKKRNSVDLKKQLLFLIPILLISFLLSVWVFIPTNKVFAKLTLLYMVPPHRAAIALGYSQIVLIIYLISSIKADTKLLRKDFSFIIAIIMATVSLILSNKYAPSGYLGPVSGFVCGITTFVLFYLFLNINDIKIKKFFIILLIAVVLVSGLFVNPVTKGVNIIYNKPVSKQIQNIVNDDKNALWLVDNLNFTIPNYVVANGARVINSTNYYPNFDLYEKILGEDSQKEEIRKIYNRYAHISVNINESNTSLELLYPDAFKINIYKYDLKNINVKYILSSRNLEDYTNQDIKFEKVYDEYGLFIFKVVY